MEIKRLFHYFRHMDNLETEWYCLSRQENSSSANFNILHIEHDAKLSESNQTYKHWSMNMGIFT